MYYGKGHIKRLKNKAINGKITTSEIIELLISYVIKGKDVKPLAKEIYKRCGYNIKKIFKIIKDEDIKGIGNEVKIFFNIIEQLFFEIEKAKVVKKKYSITTQKDVIEYYKNLCNDENKENVYVLFLNSKNIIISEEKLSEGTITQSILYPREIIKKAINNGSLSIIIIHNHPSGDPTPSKADKEITKKLIFALKEIDIILLDHIIVGDDNYFSFHEEGLIDEYNKNYEKLYKNLST